MVQPLRLALGIAAGQRGGLAGEDRHPGLDLALGEERETHEREDQHQGPQEDRGAVDDDRAGATDDAAGGAVGDLVEAGADDDGADERGDQAGTGEQHLRTVAVGAGEQRLGQHAEAGDTEHRDQRPDLGVGEDRLGELHQCSPSSACSSPAWSAAGAVTSGGSSVTPTWLIRSPT